MPMSDALKTQCGSLNLTQLIDSPTRPKPKCLEKSTLNDFALTNMPYVLYVYVTSGVFE